MTKIIVLVPSSIKLPPVQNLWIGSSLKESHDLSIRSFLAWGHPYHLYVYEDVAGVPRGVELFDAREILPREKVFAYRVGPGKGSFSAVSNLFRYLLLYKNGGWWVDSDLICLRPLDLAHPYVFATETLGLEQDKTLASCAIRVPPRSEVMRYCVDQASKMNPDTLEWGQAGPRLLHEAVMSLGLGHYQTPSWYFNPLPWTEFHRITGPGSSAMLPRQGYAVHLYNEMFRRHQLRLDCCHPTSLYQTLLERYLERTASLAANANAPMVAPIPKMPSNNSCPPENP